MKLNKFIFSEEFAYTYDEVLKNFTGGTPTSITNDRVILMLSRCGLIISHGTPPQDYYTNDGYFSFLEPYDKTPSIHSVQVKSNALKVLQKVRNRYEEHYAVVVASESEFADACEKFFVKVCNVLDYTFDKYDTLLGIYEAQKSHLLDKLQRVRDEDKTTSESESHYVRKGTNISTENESGSQVGGSKTPQTINTTGDFDELEGYWDNYDKAHESGSSSSEGSETDDGSSSRSGTEGLDATESFDPMTMMARIEEIQSQYENTMFKWVEEFDRLFIEEGNI